MTRRLIAMLLAAGAMLGAWGASKTYSEITNGIEWNYTVKNDCATLSKCKTRQVAGHVDIPSSLGGYPVTAIGTGAFSGCRNITSVQIPDSVASIGNSVFADCVGLMGVFIPRGVVEIGNGAFERCDNMSSIAVDEGNTSFCVVDGLLCNKDVSEIVSCPGSLPAVTIPKTVARIRSRAFMGCGWLTQILIPKSVVYIGAGAFGSCDRLEAIMVESGNASYCVVNGILCDKLARTTIACPGGLDSISIPSSVTDIGDYSFYGCARLSSVAIPPNVKRIGISAFAGCSGLCEIKIEEGLMCIDAGAFQSCTLLCDVVIPSTVSKIGDYVFFNCSLRVYYCSTMPPLCDGDIYDDRMTVISYVPISWNLNDELWQGMSWEYWNPPAGGTGGGLSVFTIRFDASGGYADESSRSVEEGKSLGTLPIPTRNKYKFLGWYTAKDGGTKVSATTKVTADVTYYAHWARNGGGESQDKIHELYEYDDGAAPVAAASEYNGYLYDANSGAVKGTIQVKVGKPGKDGAASVKATVQLGAKKATLKAAGNGKTAINSDGPTVVALVGGESCTVTLGSNSISGTYGAYLIDGARNFFASKSGGEAANAVLGKWLGVVSVVWDGGSVGVGIGAKGKVKVSGTLADGTKATASSQVLVGEKMLCVPVVVTKKANLAFALWLPLGDGQVIVDGLGDGAIAGKPGALGAGAKFRLDAAEFAAVFGQAVLPYLPDGIAVTQSGTKWTLPKAGKVAYKDGAVDESKLGENPSGLKLTYKAKDGSFKGSFKVYAVEGGKAKATTVNVTGVMVGTTGYGTATIKGKGGVAVTVE